MPIAQSVRASLFSVATLLAVAGFAGNALAHAHLRSETPAKDSSGPAPQELKLKFSEGLELKFTTVKLTGPNQAEVATGAASLDPADKSLLIVPVPGPLAPGKYSVDWHATATDTHKTQGIYGFTVAP
jgi:methionine-rich copper-binding protein CopC